MQAMMEFYLIFSENRFKCDMLSLIMQAVNGGKHIQRFKYWIPQDF